MEQFEAHLREHGLLATIRRSRGQDIAVSLRHALHARAGSGQEGSGGADDWACGERPQLC